MDSIQALVKKARANWSHCFSAHFTIYKVFWIYLCEETTICKILSFLGSKYFASFSKKLVENTEYCKFPVTADKADTNVL